MGSHRHAGINALLEKDFWQPIVASYLEPRDALRLGSTCRKMKETVGLTLFEPFSLGVEERTLNDSSDDFYLFATIRPVLESRCHSVIVSFDFKDQGWGNRKSQIVVVRGGSSSEHGLDEMPFGGGTVVCETPIAEHYWERRSMTYHNNFGSTYSLWYRVGGGGGHSLSIRNLGFRSLVHDDPQGTLVAQQKALLSFGGFGPSTSGAAFPSLLQAVCKCLRRHRISSESTESTPFKDIIEWFDSAGLSTKTEQSLTALETLASEMEDVSVYLKSVLFEGESAAARRGAPWSHADDDSTYSGEFGYL